MRFFYARLLLLLLVSALATPTNVTLAQAVQVPIEWHRQEHSLSCEIAALKMALGSHGIAVAERDLISQLPFDPTPKQPGIWATTARELSTRGRLPPAKTSAP